MANVETLALDCSNKATREVNNIIRQAAEDGVPAVEILNTQARHNIGVGILKPIHLIYRGHVGYYTVGLCDGVTAEIHGSSGWGVADNLLNGEVVVEGNAASSAAPALRGGRVIVKGSGGPRTAVGLKSGEVIVGGNAGYMSGFMMQNGRLIICGNAAKGLGDSMYQGQIWLGGEAEEIGSGVEQTDPEKGELEDVMATLERYKVKAPKNLKKLQSDKSLWNFNKHDFAAWKDAL